ncbi:hypothetical protein [Ponticaulis koreensis]
MLVVPPIYSTQQIDKSKIVSLETLNKSASAQMVVQCPLVDHLFIREGECYEYQTFALGSDNQGWQKATEKHYVKLHGHDVRSCQRKCLEHQIEIAQEQYSEHSWLQLLKKRLKELE